MGNILSPHTHTHNKAPFWTSTRNKHFVLWIECSIFTHRGHIIYLVAQAILNINLNLPLQCHIAIHNPPNCALQKKIMSVVSVVQYKFHVMRIIQSFKRSFIVQMFNVKSFSRLISLFLMVAALCLFLVGRFPCCGFVFVCFTSVICLLCDNTWISSKP